MASGAAPRLLSPEGDVLSPGNQSGVHGLGPKACGAEPSLRLPRAQPCAPATPRLDSCPRLPLSNPAPFKLHIKNIQGDRKSMGRAANSIVRKTNEREEDRKRWNVSGVVRVTAASRHAGSGVDTRPL